MIAETNPQPKRGLITRRSDEELRADAESRRIARDAENARVRPITEAQREAARLAAIENALRVQEELDAAAALSRQAAEADRRADDERRRLNDAQLDARGRAAREESRRQYLEELEVRSRQNEEWEKDRDQRRVTREMETTATARIDAAKEEATKRWTAETAAANWADMKQRAGLDNAGVASLQNGRVTGASPSISGPATP